MTASEKSELLVLNVNALITIFEEMPELIEELRDSTDLTKKELIEEAEQQYELVNDFITLDIVIKTNLLTNGNTFTRLNKILQTLLDIKKDLS